MKKIEFLAKKIQFLFFGAPKKDSNKPIKKALLEMLVEKRLILTACEKLKENSLDPWSCPRGYRQYSLRELQGKAEVLRAKIKSLNDLISDDEFFQVQKAVPEEYLRLVKEKEQGNVVTLSL